MRSVALCLLILCTHAATARPEPSVDFHRDIRPIFAAKCLACHGDEANKLRGGFDLRSREAMMRGGDSGEPAIVPGRPDDSPLVRAIERLGTVSAMPPKENDRLSPEQIDKIRMWIAAGAAWGEPPTKPNWVETPPTDGVRVVTSGGRSDDWTNRTYQPSDIWAYRPIQRPAVPIVAGVRHPIDAFLAEARRLKGVKAVSPPADRQTLARRIALDLTGLPPSAETTAEFMADTSAEAIPRWVDHLLASPHYGERMARHWFDVARYADSAGFANDFERPHAWRYRDYVVRSFNADKPFDRFIVEQIAGDELDPDDPEMAIAVGFLRSGPWEHTAMSVAAVTRQQFLDDVTHSVGVTFLGQGLRCAACHDHKFDPVPTKDYYRLQAVFAATQFAEVPVPFLPSENSAGFAESRRPIQQRLNRAKEELNRLKEKSAAAIAEWLKQHNFQKLSDAPVAQRPKLDRFGLNDQELSRFRILQKRIQHFERELLRYEPYAMTVYNGPLNNYQSAKLLNPMPAKRGGPLPTVQILPGGSLESPAETVTPGVLSAVWGSNDATEPSAWNRIPEAADGRRLALARWIASPANTLTARVIVNRAWQWHFGTGLVATPNNFGKMGAKPSRPELLDWLAVWFIEHGWSLKKLHRLILTSETYQRSTEPTDADWLAAHDPKNELLTYFPVRRLTAEEIRDGMLAATGELNRTAGGPGCFPEINWEVALQPRHVMGSVAPAYQPSPTPALRNRRTLYVFHQRTLSDPLLEVFNQPGSDISCECRDQTTIAPQAFALFNGEFAHDRAVALAAAVHDEADPVTALFQRVYGRKPTGDELMKCRRHVERMTRYHEQRDIQPVPVPTKVKRKMVEEMTGEEFEWDEELDGMVGYQRDRKSWDVAPPTRALADLALVLFNSNEWLYVR